MAVGGGGVEALFYRGPITDGDVAAWDSPGVLKDGGGPPSAGTVTSVGLALPVSVFSVSGSPVTTSGTLSGSFATQTANTFFAGPSSGPVATPAFRVLAVSDLPVTIVAGGPTGSSSVIPVITWNAAGQLTAVSTASISVPSAANPTASVGLTAVNGVAVTYMRSDAAPALDQTAAYAFTGLGAAAISAAVSGAVPLTISGYSLTGSQAQSMVSLAGTLNTSGSPDVFKIAVTDTARGASTKLVNIYAGAAGATSVFSLARAGAVSIGGSFVANNASSDASNPYVGFNDGAAWGIGKAASGQMGVFVNGGLGFVWTQASMFFKSTGAVRWSSSSTPGADTDTLITSGGTAKLRLGDAASATPVNYTLEGQPSRAGTDSNVGGASVNFDAGTGTGTGTLATAALRSPVAVASGSGAQTIVAGITAKVGTAILTSYTVANLPAAGTAGAGATAFVTDANTTMTLGIGTTVVGGGANKVPVYSDSANWVIG